MNRLEERIRSALQETAERIPDTVPTRTIQRAGSSRPAGVWVAVTAVVGVLILFTPILLLRGSDPVINPPGDPGPFLGTWVAIDGDSKNLVIRASGDENLEMIVRDFVPVCGEGGSTMNGTGRLQAENQLMFPTPVLTCDDGSQPVTLNGSPIEEQLQNLTFTHDPATTAELMSEQQETDVLTDNFGSVWTRESEDPRRVTPPTETEVAELVNGFLEARIAGDGAEEYLEDSEEIPLLYTTTSGDAYERAEFEEVPGIEWPYGLRAFKVRLFAGETLVEQLFFLPNDQPILFPADGGLGLGYDPHGYGTHIAPTTEDGQPVVLPYSYFDGEVTLHAAHPWIFPDPNPYPNPFGRLIPEGQVAPTTDGGERGDWDELHLVADPAPAASSPTGADCQPDEGPADAEALAESLRSYAGLEASAPVAVSVGGAEALMVDLVISAGAKISVRADEGGDFCANALLYPVLDKYALGTQDQAKGERMRFYLVDLPEGSTMHTMAIVIATESRFERAVEAAAPVVESIQFHTP